MYDTRLSYILFGGDHFEPNIRLEEHNFSRGQSSNIPHDVRASIPNTDGQLRDILPDMESNDINDQVRNTQSDMEPIDIEYLLEDNQRAVTFLRQGHRRTNKGSLTCCAQR